MLAKIVTGRMTNRLGLWLFGVVVAALLGVVATPAGMSAALPGPEFVLSSPDAQLAVSVPLVYTANLFGCTGGNKSPALQWSGAPAGTKSFVLTLFDPDEKSTPSGWWHWVVYDLPASVDKLAHRGRRRARFAPSVWRPNGPHRSG